MMSIILNRTFSSFTLETILATAFGRTVAIQKGELEELEAAANFRFRQLEEGRSTSKEFLTVLIS